MNLCLLGETELCKRVLEFETGRPFGESVCVLIYLLSFLSARAMLSANIV